MSDCKDTFTFILFLIVGFVPLGAFGILISIRALPRFSGLRTALSDVLMVSALVVALIAMLVAGVYYTISWGEKTACQWLATRELPRSQSIPDTLSAAQLSHSSFARLARQIETVGQRKRYHARLTTFYFARYNAALNIAPLAAFLAAAMALLITPAGWPSSSPYARATFVLATAAAAYFGAFPQIYKYQENASRNAELYIAYTNLQDRIGTFVAVNPSVATLCQPQKPCFVDSVDSSLVRLNDLAVGFDATRIPAAVLALPKQQ